jgi:ubiquinone/menaquinone biosynthesis C-methylase UbiE
VNAWFFAAMEATMHRQVGAAKARLFADLPPTVLELGAGAGANLRYLRRGTHLVAVEPSHFMHRPLRRRAEELGIDLSIRETPAEQLDLPDASVDAVISSLVLCSVDDVARTLAEVRRVLRPGGRFVCLEHVAAPEGTIVRRVQRIFHRPWRWIFEGCHTHRDLESSIRGAGFAHVDVERVEVDTPFVPVRPQIHAVAIR